MTKVRRQNLQRFYEIKGPSPQTSLAAIDGGEQLLHVGRPPNQLATAGGAAAHLHKEFTQVESLSLCHLRVVLALVAEGVPLLALVDPAPLQGGEADRALRARWEWR